jgi:acyl-CoA synthetase (AMP-forming)/AMP-acid ligase II
VGGFSSALAILLAGGSFVFSPSAKEVTATFQPFMMVQSISSKNDTQCHSLANTLAVVPAMLHSLFMHLQDSTNTFSGVQLILVGGQSLSDSQWDKCHRYFPNARIVQTYACTEAGSSITFADVSQVRHSSGTLGGAFVGYPPPHIDIEIIDPDSVRNGPLEWTILPCLQMGLIVTKGPHVMNHYWCRKDLTSPDSNHGWLVMNDLGYLTDQGCLYYCGRSDDVIRTGGESVLAMEVERVLIHHPMIDAVCVFPLQDEKFGQIVCAAIQPKQDVCFASDSRRINQMASMSSDALEKVRTFCSNHQLARYKHPKKVFIFHQLPQNSSGKILKFAIIKLCSESDTIYHSKL